MTMGEVIRKGRYHEVCMALKLVGQNAAEDLRGEILRSLDDETFDFMAGNEAWEELKRELKAAAPSAPAPGPDAR